MVAAEGDGVVHLPGEMGPRPEASSADTGRRKRIGAVEADTIVHYGLLSESGECFGKAALAFGSCGVVFWVCLDVAAEGGDGLSGPFGLDGERSGPFDGPGYPFFRHDGAPWV